MAPAAQVSARLGFTLEETRQEILNRTPWKFATPRPRLPSDMSCWRSGSARGDGSDSGDLPGVPATVTDPSLASTRLSSFLTAESSATVSLVARARGRLPLQSPPLAEPKRPRDRRHRLAESR